MRKNRPKVKVYRTFSGDINKLAHKSLAKPKTIVFNSLTEASWWVDREKTTSYGRKFDYEIEDELL